MPLWIARGFLIVAVTGAATEDDAVAVGRSVARSALFKTAVFGLIIGLVACFQGMRTRGGAAGVGRAATSSVVLSSLCVILADVVLVKLILIFFP